MSQLSCKFVRLLQRKCQFVVERATAGFFPAPRASASMTMTSPFTSTIDVSNYHL